MRIGELSRLSGVSIRMLRYYEAEGLLHPTRSRAGYRSYSDVDVMALGRIVTLNRAGLTLAAIRPLLACALPGTPGQAPCAELKASLRARIDDLDARIVDLSRSRAVLAAYLGEGEAP